MADETKEELYGRMAEEITAAVAEFPNAELVPPEGFQALAQGISQVWRKNSVPGVMLHVGKYGLIVDVSVAVTGKRPLAETGAELQKMLSRRLYEKFSVPISAINVDILKIL